MLRFDVRLPWTLRASCLVLASATGLVGCEQREPAPAAVSDVSGAETADDAGPETLSDPASAPASAPAAGSATVADAAGIADAPLEPWRLELLEEAFEVASLIPQPLHLNDRARAQQAIASTMLELDQPIRVAAMVNRIPGWRRGDALADLAFHRAKRGDRNDASGFLALAERIAEDATDWMRDRIRVNAARTHALLGRDAVAAGMEVDIVPAEDGVVDAVRAEGLDRERLEATLQDYQRRIEAGGFDLARNLLVAAVELYERFYDDAAVRDRILRFVTDSWSKLPIDLRIARLLDMADIAIARGDLDTARPLVARSAEILGGVQLTAEGAIPLVASIARRRGPLGETAAAAAELDAALARFEQEKRTIIDMFRPEVLRPVAEAWMALGDEAAARRTYVLALEEGAANPNARPRAQDLSATLASMARHGLRPDESMTARITAIREGLGDPW